MSVIESTVAGADSSGDSQPDSVTNFSFGDIHSKALASFEGNTPAAEPAAEQVAEPAIAAPNVDIASDAKLAQLADDQLVTVTVDGQEVTMPWSEARGGVMRQAKFTKEMQNLRQQQAAFETQRGTLTQDQQFAGAAKALLNNEQLLTRFLQEKYPNLLRQAEDAAIAQTGVNDPDDIATVGQAQAFAKNYAQQMQDLVNNVKADLEKQVAEVTTTIEDRQAVGKLTGEINTTIKGLFTEHPYINKIMPDAEQMLRYQVSKMEPRTPEETIQAFQTVFGGWVENYKATVAETTKGSVLAKQKLVENNIQPPGGASVQPAPTNFQTKNKFTGKQELDWGAMREAALKRMG